MGLLPIWGLSALLALLLPSVAFSAEPQACPALLNYEFRKLAGQQAERLCEAHRGKLILVVNTASQCGYTYQYEGLEHLYDRYRERGLVVLGFPSNDFGGQEPGSEHQIENFCRDMYSIQFPMYEKIHAAEGRAHPFIAGIARQAKQYPRWNFHKYLIDREGNLVGSWRSRTEPESDEIIGFINRYL